MRLPLLAALLVAGTSALFVEAAPAAACGGFFCQNVPVDQTGEQILFAVEGDQVVCPRHGARFCIRTGAALTAPAYEPAACLPVRVEQGEVQVRDDRWD